MNPVSVVLWWLSACCITIGVGVHTVAQMRAAKKEKLLRLSGYSLLLGLFAFLMGLLIATPKGLGDAVTIVSLSLFTAAFGANLYLPMRLLVKAIDERRREP
ncbi:hypothetical protein KJ605_01285 [Patescibacteria group bacterium]|nr:hypothetical protein [Patescibacteria group bacterium]